MVEGSTMDVGLDTRKNSELGPHSIQVGMLGGREKAG
jgi:hypothetical protein